MRTMRRHIIRALVALFLLTGVVAVFYSPTAVWTSPLCAFFPTSDRCIQGVPDVVNVLDYGATPFYGNSGDTTSDDTVAFQRAIDALPNATLTFSASARMGGIVYVPAGKYRIGTAGQMGRCSGGSAPGTPCDEVSDCPGGPPTQATAYCAWLTSNNRELHLIGAGMRTTEIGVMHGGAAGKLGELTAISIDPGDGFSSIEDLRVLKIQSQKLPAFYPAATNNVAHGILVRGTRSKISDVTVEAFGGHGVLLDGEFALANTNSCRFDRMFSSSNGGDGYRIWSHAVGVPGGSGDGSSHMFTMTDAQSNDGFGMWLRASKSTVLEAEFNTNGLGDLNISGSGNFISAYFEIAPAISCIYFNTADGDTPQDNKVWDLSGCAAADFTKVIDEGLRNMIHTGAKGFTRLGLAPLTAPQQQACPAGQYFLFVDAVTSKLRKCNNGTVSDL